MMPAIDEIAELKIRLSEKFSRKYVFLVGRATTAIYLALKALQIDRGKKVILPDLLCLSPVNAVLYNRLKPQFCDVDLDDYNLSIDRLKEIISHDVSVVMPVHLFGNPARIDEICQISRDYGSYVVEDVAQAMGGQYKGKPLGGYGDISILSFGGKIIDAGDGGAIMTDSPEIAKIIEKEMNNLTHKPLDYQKRSQEYRNYYYNTIDVDDEYKKRSLFMALPYIFEDLYIYKFENRIIGKINSELDNLSKNLDIREKHVIAYQKGLTHPAIKHPKLYDMRSIFRYSILVEGNILKSVTDNLRKDGFDASNLYQVPMHKYYPSGQMEHLFQNTDYISKHILNLWVEPRISDEYVKGVCDSILKSLNASS